MKYYIIAGEASGDLHGSNLVASLRAHDPDATIRAWGGEKMRQNGANVVKNYHDLAFMGFVEVLINLNTILKNIKFCKKYITEFAPDALILIDYPGFNLKIAKWAKKQGYKVFYYISPQVWAWKRRRVYKIKRVVDKMLCILPFEKKFYDNYGVDCQFVGHPLLDEIAKVEPADRSKFYKANRLNPRKEIIAMLPGSRKQELLRMLPPMLRLASHHPECRFRYSVMPENTEDTEIIWEVTNAAGIKSPFVRLEENNGMITAHAAGDGSYYLRALCMEEGNCCFITELLVFFFDGFKIVQFITSFIEHGEVLRLIVFQRIIGCYTYQMLLNINIAL